MDQDNTNNHSMITRSKKKNGAEMYTIDNDTQCDYEKIDKDGNLLDLIDDSENTDFDNEMFQKELSRLRGGAVQQPQRKKSPTKKLKKKKKKDNNILDLILPYILMNLMGKNIKKKNKKQKKLKVGEEDRIDLNKFLGKNGNQDNIHMEIIDLKYSDEESDTDSFIDGEGDTDIELEEDTDIELEDDVESSDDEDYDAESINEGSIDSTIYGEEEEGGEEEEEEEYEGSEAGEYDKYDDEFLELVDNDIDEEEELDYFSELKINEKIKNINELKDIKKINKSNIPLRFKVLNSNMDIRTKSIAIENIDKLSEMDISTGEYCKMDKWINGLIKIPFGKYNSLEINNENTDLDKQKFIYNTYGILDKSIYGHKDAKMHILQVIGKWIKNPKSQGNVLALQGPMGNGKTTLVKEGIAKAIDRPFAFIALGGASDSSFFDGHSYTYEGSHWGRIIDILIDSKCMNPIIYFDELDKVSETHKGEEIIHLLTHLTDPSQNSLFQDNYFPGVHIDLSKALFIFSFNDETKIDRILKDRMYVINTKGFKPQDKVMICNNYILPELMDTFLFNEGDLVFTEDSILHIIQDHTFKEEGVRNLKRCLETIISKINIYSLSKIDPSKDSIPLSFDIKDFKIPLHITKDIVEMLISKKDDLNKPPEHMYM